LKGEEEVVRSGAKIAKGLISCAVREGGERLVKEREKENFQIKKFQ